MFHNYLVTALRQLTRHKLYSFINIVGLAVGLACAVFITLFIRDELSYDTWIPNSENIFRVESTFDIPGHGVDSFAVVPFPVTTSMQAEIPEIQAQTHLVPEKMVVKVGDRAFSEMTDVVDPNFFQLIALPFTEGNPATALAKPESVVLSRAAAQKYFGTSDPVGKTVTLQGSHLLTVTGVIRDLPHNTQMVADIVLPNTSAVDALTPSEKTKGWLDAIGYGYVKLAPSALPNVVLAKTRAILDRNVDVKRYFDIPGSQFLRLSLTRFQDVHLTPKGADEMTAPGSWIMVYGFAAVGALILLIACFNFVNLATARATMRAREVSLRKVVGAGRRELVVQFLGESVLTAFLAFLLALAAVELLLPVYDGFLSRPIAFRYFADWPLTLSFAGIALAVGLFGGVYPAFVLSGFRPGTTLRAGGPGLGGSGLLRTVLVVLQFAISIGLGIAAIVIFAQIDYAHDLGLGFDRHNIVVIEGAGNLAPSRRESFIKALKSNPAVEDVTQSDAVPFTGDVTTAGVQIPGSPETVVARIINSDPDFPAAYGMKLLAGRGLSTGNGTDINAAPGVEGLQDGRNVLTTASTARRFGFGIAQAIGRTISVGAAITNRKVQLTIVGVLDDAKFEGLQTTIQPTLYFCNPSHFRTVSVRIRPSRTQDALHAIDRTWHAFAPAYPVERHFLDQMFDKLFAADEQEGAMFDAFVGIAVFIACLGLFGLAAFSTEQRTREIGVRKVFGARTRDVVWLLLWQFSVPVLVANVVAWPVAYYYLRGWLETYAYRIALSPLYFVAAGAVALAIAWATVLGHALRVARANPVHALRYE
jgi:putative ABC transport system permease protein